MPTVSSLTSAASGYRTRVEISFEPHCTASENPPAPPTTTWTRRSWTAITPAREGFLSSAWSKAGQSARQDRARQRHLCSTKLDAENFLLDTKPFWRREPAALELAVMVHDGLALLPMRHETGDAAILKPVALYSAQPGHADHQPKRPMQACRTKYKLSCRVDPTGR